jgi:hypothetical protein
VLAGGGGLGGDLLPMPILPEVNPITNYPKFPSPFQTKHKGVGFKPETSASSPLLATSYSGEGQYGGWGVGVIRGVVPRSTPLEEALHRPVVRAAEKRCVCLPNR